jgi:NAD(P)-dependent dehydrogenase (short-subunit alcohol dehydrogenase family)
MTTEEWDRVTGIDLRGAFMTLQRAGSAIRASGGGAIVVTASSAGMVSDMGFVHYSVAKAGLRQLVAVAARELGVFGIRVNAVAPGPTNTPMAAPTADIPGFHDAMNQRTPLGRMGEPGDISDAIIAMFALGWVTGQTLAVDGGLTLVAGTDFPGLTAQMIADW